MSPDNVTPIRGSTPQPPTQPPRQRKPRKGPADQVDLSFGRGEGPRSCVVFEGLKGVCLALDEVDMSGDPLERVDRYMQLSAAARVLVEILDEREL